MTNNVNKIIMLGTGTSTGVPTLGCDCDVCQSKDPKNKRLRSSAFLKTKNGKNILIDMGPDIRTQLLREGIKHLDGAILTHDHADHAHGIDDLRPFSFFRKQNPEIPVATYDQCIKEMQQKFPYVFAKNINPNFAGGIPRLKFVEVLEGHQKYLDEDFYFFLAPHSHMRTLALVHSKMAYIVDVNMIPSKHLEVLEQMQLDLLIIDCVRIKPHQTHLNLEKALGYIKQINAKFSGLTHLSHDFDHHKLAKDLEQQFNGSVAPLYDGQVLQYS